MRPFFLLCCAIALVLPLSTHAAPLREAVVLVGCDDRQGSGTVIHGSEGYVLTNAHVVKDVVTGKAASKCVVGFLQDADAVVDAWYEAGTVVSHFDATRNLDFGILRIGRHLRGPIVGTPFPFVKTHEFPELSTSIHLLGYSGAEDTLVTRAGVITGFSDGSIQSTAIINQGDSGGAALNDANALIGVPSRIVVTTNSQGDESQAFELVDLRAIMNWLDTASPVGHDAYFTHADPARYHQTAVFVANADLGCSALARSPLSDTVYCIKANNLRLAFPNGKTFFSWYPTFEKVVMASPSSLSQFQLTKNVTLKPGTLVKSATAPAVYVVTDTFGTLRQVPSEEKARALWGPTWAALVLDIPDEFWVNYTVGLPLEG